MRPHPDRQTLKSVRTIAELESAFAADRSWLDRSSDRVAAFAGRPAFVIVHTVIFGVWVVWNVRSSSPVDPYPFTFLMFLVSLEAIFLSSFVLISQNHAERRARSRAALDLQINLLAEREMTKVLAALAAIAKRLQIDACDAEMTDMAQATDVEALAHVVEEAENRVASAE